ncbi:MAG: hypothetical protein KC636_11110, partial [Myxococcales bacterium]|nr:hypothetical protein [Myxococcales bacterium]
WTRAWILGLAHASYGFVTAPLLRLLLASERLRFWWTLPLPGWWWRALHLRHLLLLNAPWLAAIGYGVATEPDVGAAAASGVAFMAWTIAAQIVIVAVADRSAIITVGALLLWALGAVAGVLLPPYPGAAVGLTAATLAVIRLGRPMPEARTRYRGVAGGRPAIALALAGGLAVARRDRLAIAWGLACQVAAVALLFLAIAHVGASEPAPVRSLQRGLAIVCAVIGATLSLRAVRLLDGDRSWLDSWGIAPRHERHARLLIAGCGALPAALIGAPALAYAGEVGRLWLVDLGVATAWATLHLVTRGFAAEAARRLHEPQLPRLLLHTFAAVVIVVGVRSELALLPWALLDAARLAAVQRRAERTRLRFETPARDGHQR